MVDNSINYNGTTICCGQLQRLLGIGYSIATDILDNLLEKEIIVPVSSYQYIFKEQIIKEDK